MQQKNYSNHINENLVYNHLCYKDLNLKSTVPETHVFFEIIFLKEGDITYVVEGKRYIAKKNSLILTRPGKNHSIYFNKSNIYDRYDILFDEKILNTDIINKIPASVSVLNVEYYPLIIELFKRMDFYYEHFRDEFLQNILVNLIEEIFYNIDVILKMLDKKWETLYTVNPILTNAIDYIEKNLSINFTLEQLCRELFITKSHLHRLFGEYMKISPKKFILSKRLEFAKMNLKQGAKPHDIYSKCGFLEYSTFWRNYKKYFGYPPSDEAKRTLVPEIKF